MKAQFFIVVMFISIVLFSQTTNKNGTGTTHRATTDSLIKMRSTSRADSITNLSQVHDSEGNMSNAGTNPDLAIPANRSSPTETRSMQSGSFWDSINGTRNSNTNIAGANDTTFNVNTLRASGTTTNLGAVDRSGQAQFGQSNWGNSRSTVGEGQWTVPPPLTASFNREFPSVGSTTWERNFIDTSIYSAKHKRGVQWVTTRYHTKGQRIDTRTEYTVLQPPRGVVVFSARQSADFKIARIYKLQLQGRPEVYEVETTSGKKVYINSDGIEVNF